MFSINWVRITTIVIDPDNMLQVVIFLFNQMNRFSRFSKADYGSIITRPIISGLQRKSNQASRL